MEKLEESFDGIFADNIRSNTYKQHNGVKKHKITINVLETQYAVIKHVSKNNKWNLVAQPLMNLNFDICWTDNHVRQDLFARMQSHQKINHFPGMTILSRKNNLGKNLMHFRKKFPFDYDFFPITWNLPIQYYELNAYHQCRQQGKAQTFIVKPQASCQGRGIYLTRNIDKLKYEKCVVQRYMHKPYLIDNLKFDLRIYVLIAGIDPLRIFVYEQGLARFATETYKPPRSQNLCNRFMHLTNYAINKQNPNFLFNQSASNMSIGHKRSLTSIYSKIKEDGYDIDQLKQKINQIIIKTVITGYPTLSQTLNGLHPENFANDMCFEVLGFDIMLDYKLNPYLIEINYTPSFTTDTPLDRHIKKNLISDTFNILNINDKWKKDMKIKRTHEIQQRMVTGKRKKYLPQQKKFLLIDAARKRDEYELKNMGNYKKIFVTSQAQMNKFLPFYDFAMDLSRFDVNRPESQNQVIKINNQIYTHYFDEVAKSTKKNKELTHPKSSNILRENKFNQVSSYNRNDYTKISLSSMNHTKNSNNDRRVSSAKNRRQKKDKKFEYERVCSKKSIQVEDECSTNEVYLDVANSGIESSTIFQNQNIQNVLLRQKQSQQQYSQNQILY